MATAQFGPTCFLVAGMLPGPLRPHGTGENFSQEDDSNLERAGYAQRVRTLKSLWIHSIFWTISSAAGPMRSTFLAECKISQKQIEDR